MDVRRRGPAAPGTDGPHAARPPSSCRRPSMSFTTPRRSRRAPRRAPLLATALVAVASAACRSAPAMPIPEPGTRPVTSAEPAAPTLPLPAANAPAPADTGPRAGHTAADARFLQHMIPHHAQALVMTALVPSRTETPGVRLVAERIAASQRSEIATMQQWLRARGETVPDVATAPVGDAAAAHAGHAMPAAGADAHAGMPGMLTAAELQRLADARGAEFDRLFLASMIRHHEGALAMVAELLATPGAAQSSEVFQIASDVDADQRAEIARMRAMQPR